MSIKIMRNLAILLMSTGALSLIGAAMPASKAESSNAQGVKLAEQPQQDDQSFVTTRTGLKYKDSVVGQGQRPQSGQTVVVHYTGWLTNGQKFDSSVDRGQPFDFQLGAGQVIKGWDEGVATMRVGGKRRLVIPPQLAYGSRGAGGVIPPNATLVFDVELLGIR